MTQKPKEREQEVKIISEGIRTGAGFEVFIDGKPLHKALPGWTIQKITVLFDIDNPNRVLLIGIPPSLSIRAKAQVQLKGNTPCHNCGHAYSNHYPPDIALERNQFCIVSGCQCIEFRNKPELKNYNLL